MPHRSKKQSYSSTGTLASAVASSSSFLLIRRYGSSSSRTPLPNSQRKPWRVRGQRSPSSSCHVSRLSMALNHAPAGIGSHVVREAVHVSLERVHYLRRGGRYRQRATRIPKLTEYASLLEPPSRWLEALQRTLIIHQFSPRFLPIGDKFAGNFGEFAGAATLSRKRVYLPHGTCQPTAACAGRRRLRRGAGGDADGRDDAGSADACANRGVLMTMRTRGETLQELVGFARAMRAHSVKVPVNNPDLLDTCGTGGDTLKTWNLSTATALVVAAAGVPVAKHGNRAVSSKCGSADVLEALGVNLNLTPEQIAQGIEQVGVGFMFAPLHHPAMRHVAPVRRELGVRTVFNLLGPLTNPANARKQLLGVFSWEWLTLIAEALAQLGTERALIVHGMDGLDEVSPIGVTVAAHLTPDGAVETFEFTPQDLGLKPAPADALIRRRHPAGECADPARRHHGRRRTPHAGDSAQRGRRAVGRWARGRHPRRRAAGATRHRIGARRSGAGRLYRLHAQLHSAMTTSPPSLRYTHSSRRAFWRCGSMPTRVACHPARTSGSRRNRRVGNLLHARAVEVNQETSRTRVRAGRGDCWRR
jgi:anthranilate phosphoribosyltransferase